jgi:hypothetical protein
VYCRLSAGIGGQRGAQVIEKRGQYTTYTLLCRERQNCNLLFITQVNNTSRAYAYCLKKQSVVFVSVKDHVRALNSNQVTPTFVITHYQLPNVHG